MTTTSKPRHVQAIGSIETLTKELGTLESWYFHHGTFLDTECKDFITEFEYKRGEEDSKALQYIETLLKDLNGNISASQVFINSTESNGSVSKCQELVKGLCGRETFHQLSRDEMRTARAPKDEEERKIAEEQSVLKRKQIDKETEEKLTQLYQKYSFVRPPTFLPSSSVVPQSSSTTSQSYVVPKDNNPIVPSSQQSTPNTVSNPSEAQFGNLD